VIGDRPKYGGDRDGSGPQNIQFPKRLGPGPGGMGPGMRKDGLMVMGPPPGMGMGMGMGLMPPMGMGREDFIRENSIQVISCPVVSVIYCSLFEIRHCVQSATINRYYRRFCTYYSGYDRRSTGIQPEAV